MKSLNESLAKISGLMQIYEAMHYDKVTTPEEIALLNADLKAARTLILTEIIETKKVLRELEKKI